MWRRRLQNKIKELTKDLSQLEASKDKDISNFSHQGLVDSYRQNRLFENNQRQFYRKLNQEEERSDDDQPVAKESKQFWGNIWSLQIIRRMQNGYKTCEVKLMLKNRRRQILPQEVLRRYLSECQIGSHQVQIYSRGFSQRVLAVCMKEQGCS